MSWVWTLDISIKFSAPSGKIGLQLTLKWDYPRFGISSKASTFPDILCHFFTIFCQTNPKNTLIPNILYPNILPLYRITADIAKMHFHQNTDNKMKRLGRKCTETYFIGWNIYSSSYDMLLSVGNESRRKMSLKASTSSLASRTICSFFATCIYGH